MSDAASSCYVCGFCPVNVNNTCYYCVRKSKIFDNREVYMKFINHEAKELCDVARCNYCKENSSCYYKLALCNTCRNKQEI